MMGNLVFVLFFLSLLLDVVLAQSPPLDPAMTAGPGESFYPDPEGILTSLCDICGISINYCLHKISQELLNPPVQRLFTARDFLDHPEWPRLPQDPSGNESDGLWAEQTHGYNQQLSATSVQLLNANATTVQPSTMQAWVEDGPYNLGDRRSPPATSHMHQRRNAPRQGGFPCDIPDCPRVYSRHCDLRRHKKTHLVRSERPHKCSICDEGFIYPKDRDRHQRTHAPQEVLFCPVQGCNNRDGFSRRDNLQRHMRRQHPQVAVAA